MSTDAGTKPGPRALRDRPIGRIAILLGVLALAFVVARACAGAGSEIPQEEAVAIARGQVSYEPERTQVRLIRRGTQSRPFWAVSLSLVDAQGELERVTVVIVDARSGRVVEIHESDE